MFFASIFSFLGFVFVKLARFVQVVLFSISYFFDPNYFDSAVAASVAFSFSLQCLEIVVYTIAMMQC